MENRLLFIILCSNCVRATITASDHLVDDNTMGFTEGLDVTRIKSARQVLFSEFRVFYKMQDKTDMT